MCWVMPPASVSTTADSRMASSSVVLPWSTWPMIVTTGGRSLSVVGGVLERDLLGLLVGRVADRDLALELAADQLDGLVAQRLRDLHHLAGRHHERDDLRRRDAELLGEVLDGDPGRDLDGTGRRLRLAALLLARCAALAALARTAAGLGVDHDPAAATRRRPPLRAGMAAGLAGVRLAERRPSRRRRAAPRRRRRRRARPASAAGSAGASAGVSAAAFSVSLGFSCSTVFFATTSILPRGPPAAPCAPAPPGRRAA